MIETTLHVLDSESYAERAVAGLHGARLSCCIQQQLAIDTVYYTLEIICSAPPLTRHGLDHAIRCCTAACEDPRCTAACEDPRGNRAQV